VGGSHLFLVTDPACADAAEAVALARRIVADSAAGPAELKLWWLTDRVDAVAALADRWAAMPPDSVRYDLDFRTAQPQQLLAAIAEEGGHVVYPFDAAEIPAADAAPVEVHAQLDGVPDPIASMVRLAAICPRVQVEVDIGEHDRGAAPDEATVDSVVAVAVPDPLMVRWDCWFRGAAGGYNGVELFCNINPEMGEAPGRRDLFVAVDRRGDSRAVARQVAARSALTIDPEPRYRN
jgi:hypothetical protein